MIGSIRLVNPWRGTIWGSFGPRLRVTTSDGEHWEIHYTEAGSDFWPGRSFSRQEIEAWAEHDPLSEAELACAGIEAEDALGAVPARDLNPRGWKWYAVTAAGEVRLSQEAKPYGSDLAIACREAIEADSLESIPLIDRFELWGCDIETGAPIALLLTGTTEAEARGNFSPLWRCCRAAEQTEERLTLEHRVNERICSAVPGDPSRVRFLNRLFERTGPTEVRELPLGPNPISDQPLVLERAILAKPWVSEYQALCSD